MDVLVFGCHIRENDALLLAILQTEGCGCEPDVGLAARGKPAAVVQKRG